MYKVHAVFICTCRYKVKVHRTWYTLSPFIICICICIYVFIKCCHNIYKVQYPPPRSKTSTFQQPCSKPKLETQYVNSDRAELGWGLEWFWGVVHVYTYMHKYMQKAGRTYVAQMGAGNDKLTDRGETGEWVYNYLLIFLLFDWGSSYTWWFVAMVLILVSCFWVGG